MNPQSEARQQQLVRLREVADEVDGVAPVGTATHIRQAANEIESLGALAQEEVASFLHRLQLTLADCLRDFFAKEVITDEEPMLRIIMEDDQPSAGDMYLEILAKTQPLQVKLAVSVKRWPAWLVDG